VDLTAPEGTDIRDAIPIATGPFPLGDEQVEICWRPSQERVGLFLNGTSWADLNVIRNPRAPLSPRRVTFSAINELLPEGAMTAEPFKAKAYVKEGCPFSFKYWLFVIEAGLEDHIEVVRCNPQDAGFESLKAKLAAALGKRASFPTVEIEPGRYQSDSDKLIGWYAERYNIDIDALPALAFYKETIFPQIVEFHKTRSQSAS